jgi:broad specificity phosphatase PhoE
VLALVLAQGCGTVGRPEVVYIARHGQTEWNRVGRFQGDPDLDPVGYINRANLWLVMKDRPLAAIYTSQRLRTRRTADLVARQHRLPLNVRPALNEIEPGVFEGMCISELVEEPRPWQEQCEVKSRGSNPEATLEKLRPMFKKAWVKRVDGRMPLGQSMHDLSRQVRTFVDELDRGYRKREVLVVGHGVVNRTLLHHIMGWPLEAVAQLHQANDQIYRIATKGGRRVLSLYTPGHGWVLCKQPPEVGDRLLDCHPRQRRQGAAPSPQPAAPTAPSPAPAPSAEPAPPAEPPAPTELPDTGTSEMQPVPEPPAESTRDEE